MSGNGDKIIRVGSRKSELALIQSKFVIACLQKQFPEKKFEIHTMTTMGDRVLNKSLPKIGEKALFTKDLEDALRNGGVDFVVHSLKDLPTVLPTGMAIGAVLERDDPRDALVLNAAHAGKTLKTLPAGSVIGTSSLRRTAQLSRCYPHLIVSDVRGNLNTRLAKLDAPNSKFSGLILANAGLVRMGWQKRIDQVLDADELLYAVGQGALAVECRSNDTDILEMLSKLVDVHTQCRILAERSFLKTLGGGCSAPVAVETVLSPSKLDDYKLNITGAVWSLDGKIELQNRLDCVLVFDDATIMNEIGSRKRANREDKNGNSTEDIENEIIPAKCPRMSSPRGCENCSKRVPSPSVIDDSKLLASGNGKTGLDIEAIINIHGDLFKKCPFSVERQKERMSSASSDATIGADGCPLDIPIGQEVMGQCPYFDTNEKIDLAQVAGGRCPVILSHPISKDEVDDAAAPKESVSVLKCPFSQANLKVEQPSGSASKDIKLNLSKCPFLAQQSTVDLIEYAEKVKTADEMPLLVDDSETLFCGMYRHPLVKYDVFQKCEELGRSLANKLIDNGALEVMSCAQSEIRASS